MPGLSGGVSALCAVAFMKRWIESWQILLCPRSAARVVWQQDASGRHRSPRNPLINLASAKENVLAFVFAHARLSAFGSSFGLLQCSLKVATALRDEPASEILEAVI